MRTPNTQKKIHLDFLYHDRGKQSHNFEVCWTWKDPVTGEIHWGKRICYLHAQQDDPCLTKINNREILHSEITFDLDLQPNETPEALKERCNQLVKTLRDKNVDFEVYHTGSKGFHVHTYWDSLLGIEGERLRSIKLRILKAFGADLMKASQRTMIALENAPHWKTGNLKTLIDSNKPQQISTEPHPSLTGFEPMTTPELHTRFSAWEADQRARGNFGHSTKNIPLQNPTKER